MRRHKVLVVDDSLVIRGIIESIIVKDNEWQLIGPASDVESARALMEDHHPDVITLDLALPGTDGLTFLAELRGLAHPPVVVISSSARPGSPEAKEAKRRGAVACFDKSRLVAEAPKLLRTLRRIVARA